MDADLKRRWLEALKSGEYPKTKGRLHYVRQVEGDRPVGYCCLGVLCKVMGVKEAMPPFEDRVSKERIDLSCSAFVFTDEKGREVREYAVLPHFVAEEVLGDSASNPVSHMGELVRINDATTTFDHVIKYIEEKL